MVLRFFICYTSCTRIMDISSFRMYRRGKRRPKSSGSYLLHQDQLRLQTPSQSVVVFIPSQLIGHLGKETLRLLPSGPAQMSGLQIHLLGQDQDPDYLILMENLMKMLKKIPFALDLIKVGTFSRETKVSKE